MSQKKSAYSKRKKISEIEKKCEESLNEILRSANEATEISKKAEEELEHQTEQIIHISKETEHIEENLNQSQYHLEGIKYWWKNINSFLGFENPNNNENKNTNNQLNDNINKKTNYNYKHNYAKNDNRFCRNSLNLDGAPQRKGTFDEKYESDLNTLSSMLDELHTRALVMGNTIKEQNRMLGNTSEKMEHNIEKIRDQQKVMKDIMKK
ncbi:SNARE protein [Plasmodium gonderi]|uniref:SNARE protein n=1 Tax=Plasmodium gonderi TaxID=77519 RepID=A0A1Y1JME7_PLAGO|nr:SNARE protein [Plasmodium gonderi]GAW83410.1 SNARE protein [Plasmodium gonderi]